jgi:hemerythrin
MDSFKWKENFNIGIEEIDNQHKSFLECLNDCCAQISINRGSLIDKSLIDKLSDYASTHFKFEENLMEFEGYPEIEQHRKMHQYFELQVAEMEISIADQEVRSLKSVLPFLRDWLLNHIIEQDKKFASYLKKS